MQQSRLGSLYEVWINMLIGFVISYLMNLVILNWVMHKQVSLAENFWIGVMFTIVSIVRSYVVRRYFNKRLHEMSMRLAGGQE